MSMISKENYVKQCKYVLDGAKASLKSLETEHYKKWAEGSYAEIREHDPVLADLAKNVDFASVEPLKNVIAYLEKKLEG